MNIYKVYYYIPHEGDFGSRFFVDKTNAELARSQLSESESWGNWEIEEIETED